MILDQIVASTKQRVEAMEEACSLGTYRGRVDWVAIRSEDPFPFESALKADGMNFICEVKKASPSKGLIAKDFPYVDIALEYERAGAAAISVLTEPYYFQGSSDYLHEISEAVNIPVLCKDFIIDEIQLFAAKSWGASAVLLIASILSEAQIKEYIRIADTLNLSCLVETHDEEEVSKALRAGARIVGVNNRNLKDFSVDINRCLELRNLVPKETIFVAESGLSRAEDIQILRQHHIHAALIGESLMRADDKVAMVRHLYGQRVAPRVKCCGLRRSEDIAVANELLPEYVGFVFAPSKRQVTVEEAKALVQQLDSRIQSVGVFVSPTVDEVVQTVDAVGLDVVQVHGGEIDNTYLLQLRDGLIAAGHPQVSIWQAIAMAGPEDRERIERSIAQAVLVDRYDSKQAGGTGRSFPWEWVKHIERDIVLAGGLSAQNARRAMRITMPLCVDASSALEGDDGYKDPVKMKRYIDTVRSI